jgi:glycosyltransferase involved in cell wall biosynthesis
MRILYLADAGSIHTQRWVEHFANKGHEVHLISYRSWGGGDIQNMNLYQLKMSPLPINLLRHVKQIRRLIKIIKPDLLHAHYISTYGFLGALSGFRPLIMSAWGSDVLVVPENSKIGRFKVKYALQKANLILANHHYLMMYLHERFKLPLHKITELPIGVDVGTFHRDYQQEGEKLRSEFGINQDGFVVLSPRHCREHYRIEYIIRAMPYITARYQDAILIVLTGIGGEPEYENKMEDISNELGVARNVRIIHRGLSPHEMAALYNMADALVSVPVSDEFAISISEGMICGAVPIVCDLDVYREYLKDGVNAHFVQAENPQQIAQKVCDCIEHPEQKKSFFEINKRIIEDKENWGKSVQELEELYVRLAGQSNIA